MAFPRLGPWLSILCWCCFAAFARTEAREIRDLVIVAGQSNAVGFDAYAAELPPDAGDEKVLFWFRVGDPPPDAHDVHSGRQWTRLRPQPRGEPLAKTSPGPGEPVHHHARQYGNFGKAEGGFGPEFGFARELVQAGRERLPLAILKVAFSGTAVATDWDPSDPGFRGACYRALVEEFRKAMAEARAQDIELRPRALVWVQGESDATPTHAPSYERNLGSMLDALRRDLSAPELLALLSVNTRFGNDRNPYVPVVVAAQRALAAKDPRCVYVDPTGAETLGPSHTHFTAAGTLDLGRRMGRTLLDLEERRRPIVVLTFDDSVVSHATYVAPLLRKYGFGATFFITEGFEFTFDKKHYMTWEQIEMLNSSGFEIGNHTRRHTGVGMQTSEQLRADVEYIEQQCEARGIPRPVSFCYPGYQTSANAVQLLKERGYQYARAGGAQAFDPRVDNPLQMSQAFDGKPESTVDQFRAAVASARDGRVAVMTFHGVPDIKHPWVNTDPAKFEAYLAVLRETNSRVIALRDLGR